MRPTRLFSLVCLATVALAPAAPAEFITYVSPGSTYATGGTYIGNTTPLPNTVPEFDAATSLSGSGLTATFSTPLQSLSVDNGSWATWGSPPFTETDSPDVLWTQGVAILTIEFNAPVATFGIELQPDEFGVSPLSVQFRNGSNVVGTITRNVDGDSGARLFAASATDPTLPFTSVRVTSGGPAFALADVRFQPLLSPTAVPAPPSLVLLATLPLVAFLRSRSLRVRRNSAMTNEAIPSVPG